MQFKSVTNFLKANAWQSVNCESCREILSVVSYNKSGFRRYETVKCPQCKEIATLIYATEILEVKVIE